MNTRCLTHVRRSQRYSGHQARPSIVWDMHCGYCGQQATVSIPATPERVCLTHALEFWAGLLVYVKEHSDPCEKQETPCACVTCHQLSALTLSAFNAQMLAGAAAGPAADSERAG